MLASLKTAIPVDALMNLVREIPKGLFVCGTDTGVGKTAVSALLLALMREAGWAAAPMKPVETGCRGRSGARIADDLERCLAAAGMQPCDREKQWMAPYRLALPASPHLAARLERRRIQPAVIRQAYQQLTARYRPLIVEGAGGLRVPLNASFSNLDLIEALQLPVILVARSGLGTINHSMLTLAALAQRSVPVVGIIFNDGPDEDARIAADNQRCIPRLGRVACLGRIPFCHDLKLLMSSAARDPAVLEALVPGRKKWLRRVLRYVG